MLAIIASGLPPAVGVLGCLGRTIPGRTPGDEDQSPGKTSCGVTVGLLVAMSATAAKQYDIASESAPHHVEASRATAKPNLGHDSRLLDSAISSRETFGYRSDRAFVRNLQDSERDVGTAKYGIPLTEDELVDFERRLAIQRIVYEGFDEAARERPDFAGRYIDHAAGGRVVVLTTGNAADARDDLVAIEPRLANELVVREVQRTEAELRDASRRLFMNTQDHFPNVGVYSTWVDTPAGEIVVTVPPSDAEVAQQLAEDASDALDGIPIRIEPFRARC